MSHEEEVRLANLALCVVLLAGAVRLVALGCWALGALVQLGIRVSQLDCDVSNLFLEVSYGL